MPTLKLQEQEKEKHVENTMHLYATRTYVTSNLKTDSSVNPCVADDPKKETK